MHLIHLILHYSFYLIILLTFSFIICFDEVWSLLLRRDQRVGALWSLHFLTSGTLVLMKGLD